MDNKGQISLELIIVAFAIIALALYMFTNLRNTAEQYTGALGNKTNDLVDKINKW